MNIPDSGDSSFLEMELEEENDNLGNTDFERLSDYEETDVKVSEYCLSLAI